MAGKIAESRRTLTWAHSSAAERTAHNRLVVGSNPTGPTNRKSPARGILIHPKSVSHGFENFAIRRPKRELAVHVLQVNVAGKQQATLDFLGERVGLDPHLYVLYNVDNNTQPDRCNMKTIQIVIDEALLRKVDRATQDQNIPRSQFIREALEDALRQLAIREMEQKHLAGYRQHPVTPGEFDVWESEQIWE